MATLRKTLQQFNSARSAPVAPSVDRGKDVNPQQVSSIPDDDFSGKGVDLNVKYYGKCEVTEPRGEKVAHSAMRDLKQQLLAASGHKQRVTVNLSMFGVTLYDDRRVREIAKHAVKAISFMTIDPEDTKVFSYIAAEGPDEQNPTRVFRLYCFKSEKQTALITKSMMRIFKLAHEEKKRQLSQKTKDGQPLTRRGTTKDSPLPPLPPGSKANESPYATLSSSVSPTRAKSIKNRNSLQLMDFNSSTDQTTTGEPPPPPSSSTASTADDQTYAAVNPGSKHTFNLAQFGLILSAVDDIGALPAPIGMPYKDVARNPFEEPEEAPVRTSTIMSFDPVFGGDGAGGGGGGGGATTGGFDADFPAFPDAADSEQGQAESQVYAVPRFPPIRAVLGDDECDDDVGRDSGDLFGS